MLRLIAGLAIVATLAAAKEDDRGRPVVLLVHGRGMLDRDTAATRKMWVDAISSGAGTINGQRLYSDRDVRVVWYADVLDPRSTSGCDYKKDDARARRAASDPDIKEVVSTAGSILSAITALVDDSGAVGQLRALSADAAFLTDARKRCASEQRLADALDRAKSEGRPVILVAHSLGAVVAFDYLSSRTDTGVVDKLITIGSLVGASDLRRLLIGGDGSDSLTRPASVKSWINVRNESDLFAAPIAVGKDVLTSAPSDEPDPHEMVGYLRGAATNAEVAADWCAAFPGKPPAELRFRSPSTALSPRLSAIWRIACLIAWGMTHFARWKSSIFAAVILAGLAFGRADAQSRVGADSARRLDRFGRDLAYGTVEGLAYAGLDQIRNQPPEWDRSWGGYGKRAASNVGEFYIQEGVTEGLAAAMDRPLDYVPCDCRGSLDRVGWALQGALFDRTKRGQTALAIPRIAGAFAGSFAQASWRPSGSNRSNVALLNGATSLALGGVINLYHEFAPWSSGNRCRRSGNGACARVR